MSGWATNQPALLDTFAVDFVLAELIIGEQRVGKLKSVRFSLLFPLFL
jgi:hypothetical protein